MTERVISVTQEQLEMLVLVLAKALSGEDVSDAERPQVRTILQSLSRQAVKRPIK